jgi:hypothetical protein
MAMKSLTLDQVKQAGRFAWRVTATQREMQVFWPRSDFLGPHVTAMDGESPYVFRQLAPTQTGWHHLPGCDCEFCRG